MNKRFSIFLLLAILLSSCGKPATPPPPPTATQIPPTSTPTATATPTQLIPATVTPVCISSEPTQADIDRVFSYTGEIFNDPAWERTEIGASVSWQNVGHGAAVYVESLVFPCGYEDPDLNVYFSDQNWQAIFANYESYQFVTKCRTDTGIRLYQFKTQNQGFTYTINYWAQSDTDTRVIVAMIVFPFEEQALLGTYSAQLFPDLPNCS